MLGLWDVQVLLPGQLSPASPVASKFLVASSGFCCNQWESRFGSAVTAARWIWVNWRKNMLKHSSCWLILLECVFPIDAFTWQWHGMGPKNMKEDDLRHVCILLLDGVAAGSELSSLPVRCFLYLPWGWTSPPDLGASSTDILSGNRSWVCAGDCADWFCYPAYPLQLILFFKKNFWSEIRYVLVDSQQFSVKCPKMACAPGSGCWGSGCSHPVPCLGGWGRVLVQGVTPGPSKGGLQPRVLKGNTEISDILQTGKWHCRCHLMEGAERWLGWVSGLFKCVFWRWGSCLGGFFYLFVVVWVFYLFMKSLKRKQTYSIWLHMYNMLPWIRWVLTGV